MISNGAVTTCFHKFGLSRLDFEHATFRMLGERSNRLCHRRRGNFIRNPWPTSTLKQVMVLHFHLSLGPHLGMRSFRSTIKAELGRRNLWWLWYNTQLRKICEYISNERLILSANLHLQAICIVKIIIAILSVWRHLWRNDPFSYEWGNGTLNDS